MRPRIPKLIKALRESLGKTKLITVTITGDAASSLASEAAGIRAGEYIDYAWTWVNTKIMNPWEDSSIEKPIAGLDKSQYGGFSTNNIRSIMKMTNRIRKRYEKSYMTKVLANFT